MSTIQHTARSLRVGLARVSAISLALASALTISASAYAQDMLSLVPAETSYVVRIQQSNLPPLDPAARAIFDSPIWSQATQMIQNSPDKGVRFFGGLGLDLVKGLQGGGLSQLGIDSSDFDLGVYGLGIWPVATLKLSNRALFERWVKSAAEQNKIPFTQSATNSRVYNLCDDSKVSCVMVFADNRVNISLFMKRYEAQILPYLTGEKRPAKSIKSARILDAMAQNAGAPKHQLAWFSIIRLAKTFLGLGEGITKELLPREADLSARLTKVCVDEYLQMINQVPDVYFGQSDYTPGQDQKAVALLRFAGKFAEVSKTLYAENVYQTPSGGLFGLSFHVNVNAWLNAIQGTVQSLLNQPYKCAQLTRRPFDRETLSKIQMGLQFVPMIARGFRGVHVRVVDVGMGKAGPEINALAMITMDQAPMALQLLKNNAPPLAQINFPQAGAPAQTLTLPKPLPPQVGELKVKLTQSGLGIAIGARATQLLESSMKQLKPGRAPTLAVELRLKSIMETAKTLIGIFQPNAPPMVKNALQSNVEHSRVEVHFTDKGLLGTSSARISPAK